MASSNGEELTGLVDQLWNFNFYEALCNIEPRDVFDDEDLINEILNEIGEDETGPVDAVVKNDSVKLEPVEVIQIDSEDESESGDPPAESVMRGSSPPPFTTVGFCGDSRNPKRARYSTVQQMSNPRLLSIAGPGAAVPPSVHRVTNAGYSGIDSEVNICTQVCQICHKDFELASDLQHHNINVHNLHDMVTHTSGDRKYSCRFCRREFRDNIAYFVHKSLKTKLHCHTCSLEFQCEGSLVQHYIAIHIKGLCVRQVPCEICDKLLGTRHGLALHYLTHLTGKRYSCQLCDKFFKTSNGLYTHLTTSHKMKK